MRVTCPSCDRPYRERNFVPGAARKCPHCEDVIYLPMDQVPEAYLVPLEGDTAGKRIPLAARMVIGRAHDCEIHVLDNTLSRQHAEVCLDRGKFVVCDMDSRNAVMVNGKVVSEWELTHHDVIQLGSRTFRFEMIGETSRPAAWMPEEKTRLSATDENAVEESSNTIRISAADSAALIAKLFGPQAGAGAPAPAAPAPVPVAPAGKAAATPQPVPVPVPQAAPKPQKAKAAPPARTELQASDAFQATPTQGAGEKAYACLRALHHIGDAVFSVVGEEAIFGQVLDQVLQAVSADRASIVRKNAERDDFVITASRSREAGRKDAPLSANRTAMLRVTGQNTNMLVNFGDDANLVMYAPFSTGSGVAEALAVDRLASRSGFDGDDLEMLSAIARQASMTLEMLRLPASPAASRPAPAPKAEPRFESQLAEVVVLSAELHGFSPKAAAPDAHQVVEVVNQYLALVERVLDGHGAKVDRTGGDFLRAFWGAPEKREDDVLRAARCAGEIHTELIKLNTLMTASGLQPVQASIGIHCGSAVAGSLGSEARARFSVVGEAADLASQVVRHARPGETLVTDSVLDRLGKAARATVLSSVALPGREGALAVHVLKDLTH